MEPFFGTDRTPPEELRPNIDRRLWTRIKNLYWAIRNALNEF